MTAEQQKIADELKLDEGAIKRAMRIYGILGKPGLDVVGSLRFNADDKAQGKFLVLIKQLCEEAP